MKTFTFKNWMFLCLGIMVVGLGACSKETVDNMGRDTALNIIRTGTWESWTKTVAGSSNPDLNVTVQILEEGETLNFDKDGAWHKKNDGTAQSHTYHMPTSKSMVFDGVEYQIKESIVGGVSTLTLTHIAGAVTTTMVFKRKR